MILGYTLLALALAATVLTSILFMLAALRAGSAFPSLPSLDSGERSDSLLENARRMALVSCLFVVAASTYLAYLISTHQFQFTYVAEYSARRSAPRYLFAAFWGGQEGSILLWTLWTSVLGAVLARRAGGREAKVWPIFSLVQCFLLVLVMVRCPFHLGTGPVPADGQGLNPLLENHWMVIHPPILFLGFSSLAVPWAWAVYGLVHRDWDGWLQRAFPWILFSFGVHGFGVALGGYWAYETLGWGGFWGWDPVEVSSLVPWLFLIALLHGAAIQRKNGGYKAANFFLAALPFTFMSYGTFLTRTGLLADFSVHSFSSLGKNGFDLLLGEVLGALLIPVTLLIARFKSIPKTAGYDQIVSREFGFFVASIVLGMIGLITAAGMSAPVITKLWIPKGAAAQPEYYNQAVYPLAILMLLMMAATPYMSWRSSKADAIGRRLLPGYAGALVLTAVFFALGCRKPWMLLLFATSVFTIISNVLMLPSRVRRPEKRSSVGGFMAHTGAAMLLAGIACLVAFSQQALHITLVKNQPVVALGYKLTYLGMTSQPYDRANALRIRVEKDGRAWDATPHLYIAPWNGTDTLFANPPDIRNFLWGDLYLAHYRGPSSLSFESPNNGMSLHPSDTVTYGEYTLTYHGLKWSADVGRAMAEGGDAMDKLPEMRISGLVDVTYRGATYPIRPVLVFDQVRFSKYSIPAALPGAPHAIITLNDVQLPFGATMSTSNLPDPLEMVQVDLSTKPMIWLVWMGTALYTLGGLIAYRRRAREWGQPVQDLQPTEDEPAPLPDTPVREREAVAV